MVDKGTVVVTEEVDLLKTVADEARNVGKVPVEILDVVITAEENGSLENNILDDLMTVDIAAGDDAGVTDE